MKNSPLAGAKTYANFERGVADWDVFERAATSTESHWFKDLLSLWRPSGQPSGVDGLRLAIRNGYLNFYRCGQSVARVESVSNELVAHIHYKYVLGAPLDYSGPLYLRLNTKGVFSKAVPAPDYEDLATLHKWIDAAGKYVGVEKRLVDEFVGKNDNVVDMEMALPAWAESKVAVRMDLVAIEARRVVFWEVKTANDSRIRCKADFLEDEFPHVLKQLSHYRAYLKCESHRSKIKLAYQNTAERLVELGRLADNIRARAGQSPLPLGRQIVAAIRPNDIDVEGEAALVVVGLPAEHKEAGAWDSWTKNHASKLKGKIPMLVVKTPRHLSFAEAQLLPAAQ